MMTTEEVLNAIVEKHGWADLFGYLQNICFEQDLPELYRELDNLIVNYVPDVR